MTGLLICAAVAYLGAWSSRASGLALGRGQKPAAGVLSLAGLALIAVALWLAYAAGGV